MWDLPDGLLYVPLYSAGVLTWLCTSARAMPGSSRQVLAISIHRRLIDSGVIDGDFRFTCDYLFSSPSTAASIVRGASTNGRTEWKNQQGLMLSQVEAREIGE